MVDFLFHQKVQVTEKSWSIFMNILRRLFGNRELQSLLKRHDARIEEAPAALLRRRPQQRRKYSERRSKDLSRQTGAAAGYSHGQQHHRTGNPGRDMRVEIVALTARISDR